MRKTTVDEFIAQATKLYGEDRMTWRFKCPACGHVACAQDYKDAGAPAGAVGFSCVGRWLDTPVRGCFEEGPGPCDYAGGGLFGLHHVEIDGRAHFELADL